MTKAELIAAMAAGADITRDQARLALDAFTDTVTGALKKGDDVRIVGFGAFVVVDRKAGVSRNPQTGATISRPASRTARFRLGEGLKSVLNG
ncbi:HU family DNA-binding protein [Brevundimonas goettingensis]|uniref:HU family DNA-binding protein n=1 Tax=Brevundimonas goettingensis TaxID=2774190 RepID=A0A975C2N8_9CAUL|nr:HU family DNA-binding protein [Brevundimonas goettingensis]QTC92731.1 HU family DNA-binding protein [Brevundimonas goettingensis]